MIEIADHHLRTSLCGPSDLCVWILGGSKLFVVCEVYMFAASKQFQFCEG